MSREMILPTLTQTDDKKAHQSVLTRIDIGADRLANGLRKSLKNRTTITTKIANTIPTTLLRSMIRR